jgi:hypothetical protein
MLLTTYTNGAEVHLNGGGFKEGYIPVFVSSCNVNSERASAYSEYEKLYALASSLECWSWNISFGKKSAKIDIATIFYRPMLVCDRTRENTIAPPEYSGVNVLNETKYSSAGIVSQDIEIQCTKGKYIKIGMPESAGNIVVTPHDMLGLYLNKDKSGIEGTVDFLGVKIMQVGTINGNVFNIILRSELFERIL